MLFPMNSMPRKRKEFWHISEIKPTSGKINIIATVISRISYKSFKRGEETHHVAEFLVGDRTGIIVLVIWDDLIDKIEIGETYLISNIRPRLYMNQLRIVCTKDSKIEKAPFRISLDEINTSPKISLTK